MIIRLFEAQLVRFVHLCAVRRASHHLAANPVLEGFLLTWISIGLLSQASKLSLCTECH